MLLKAYYLKDVIGFDKVQGLPFKASEIEKKAIELLTEK